VCCTDSSRYGGDRDGNCDESHGSTFPSASDNQPISSEAVLDSSHRLFTVNDRESARITDNGWYRREGEKRWATPASDNEREPSEMTNW